VIVPYVETAEISKPLKGGFGFFPDLSQSPECQICCLVLLMAHFFGDEKVQNIQKSPAPVFFDYPLLMFSNVKLKGVDETPGPPPVITISALVIPNKLISVFT